MFHGDVPVTPSCPRLSGIHKDAGDAHQLSQYPRAPLPLGEGLATSVLPLPPHPGTYLMVFFSLRPRLESGVPTVSREVL